MDYAAIAETDRRWQVAKLLGKATKPIATAQKQIDMGVDHEDNSSLSGDNGDAMKVLLKGYPKGVPYELLSEQLRAIRTERKLTVEKIADLSGVSITSIENVLYSRGGNLKLESVLRLVETLGINLQEMLE